VNKEILILKNIPREGPGIIEQVLKEYKLPYRVLDFDEDVNLHIEDFGALIVLGGPDSANDLSAKMDSELALIRNAVMSDLPYLGICLGLQTFVKALDGVVLKSPVKEVGFRDPENKFFRVKLTPDGRKDKLFEYLPDDLKVFQLHGETVELTSGMQLLATGYYCRNQVVKYGKWAYGIQSHFELTEEMIHTWIAEDPDLQELDKDLLMNDFRSIESEYQKTGNQIFTNFLTLAGLIKQYPKTRKNK
jgi:GMP synthase (glutamine-hydrolysing)